MLRKVVTVVWEWFCVYSLNQAHLKKVYTVNFSFSNIRNADKSTWKWFLFTPSRKDYQIMIIRRP